MAPANASEAEGDYSSLTCADYFPGIGLVRLRLEQAGWSIVFSNDWSHSKYEMYSAYHVFEQQTLGYPFSVKRDINSLKWTSSTLMDSRV